MPDEKMFSIETFADGAVAEQINDGLRKVIENIADPNTDLKTKRKLNVTLTFTPDDDRNLANVDILVKPTLAPAAAMKTRIIIDRDREGNVVGAEYRKATPGQVFVADTEEAQKIEEVPDLPPGLRVIGASK